MPVCGDLATLILDTLQQFLVCGFEGFRVVLGEGNILLRRLRFRCIIDLFLSLEELGFALGNLFYSMIDY